ncbi:hypothetical protein EC968_006911 [Mortierella alpina]|nr:hypothetical protein EC968_006911 [Mortierella alpina]
MDLSGIAANNGMDTFVVLRIALVKEYPVPCDGKAIIYGIDHAGLLVVLEVTDVLTGDVNIMDGSLISEFVLRGKGTP